MGLSTPQIRKAWSDYECAPDKMIVIDFGPDRIRVAPPSKEAWQALAAVLATHKYDIRVGDTDSYNCRNIKGGSTKSLHSYGIALDINWHTNPYKPTPNKRKIKFSDEASQEARGTEVKLGKADTDMTRAMVNDALAIKTEEGKQVFEWGGDWNSLKDAMHFQVDISPDDLEKGIDWSTVNGDLNAIHQEDEFKGGAKPVTDNSPTSAFEKCQPFIKRWEGGYNNHIRDRGGATNWGITIGTLSSWRGRRVSIQEVKDLTEREANEIFFARYWRAVKGDELPLGLALMTYNAGVNSGPSRGVTLLQRALNAIGAQLAEDGVIGPKTLGAANGADEREAVSSYKTIHAAYYRRLRDFDAFGNGWMNRLDDVTKGALQFVDEKHAPQTGGGDEIDAPTWRSHSHSGPIYVPDRSYQNGDYPQLPEVIDAIKVITDRLGGRHSNIGRILERFHTNEILELAQSLSEKGKDGKITLDELSDLPVNNFLGKSLGRLLNGRKTAIGAVGLVGTLLFPQFAGIVDVLLGLAGEGGGVSLPDSGPATENVKNVAQTVFGAIAAWGGLGKFEKWFKRR